MIVLLVLGIHQLLYWIYVWQLKEYRFDRWWDWLINDGDWWWKQFDLRIWYRPKFTLRAILNVVFGLVLMIFMWRWYWLLGILIVGMGIKIFDPLFNWQKRRIVNRAKEKIKKCRGVVIGVTGSFGKSTTKEMLVEVLSHKYKIVFTPNNVNTEIGVANTVLNWNNDFEIGVVEMGAYKMGEIKAICDMVRPKYGVITGLGDQHLSLFGSTENIKKAKYELIDSLPKNGKGWVINRDFSINDAKNINQYQGGVVFEYGGIKFDVPILGKQLITNILVVIKVAMELGMKKEEIAISLKNLDVGKYWPKKIEVNMDLVVIDNSYNASVNSFLSLLEYLKTWQGYKKILVTPGMIELGINGKKDHETVGKELREIDQVFLTSDRYFDELNKWGNVELVEIDQLTSKIRNNYGKKTVVVFKSRIPRNVIDQIINDKGN